MAFSCQFPFTCGSVGMGKNWVSPNLLYPEKFVCWDLPLTFSASPAPSSCLCSHTGSSLPPLQAWVPPKPAIPSNVLCITNRWHRSQNPCDSFRRRVGIYNIGKSNLNLLPTFQCLEVQLLSFQSLAILNGSSCVEWTSCCPLPTRHVGSGFANTPLSLLHLLSDLVGPVGV